MDEGEFQDLITVRDALADIIDLPAGEARAAALQRLLSSAALLRSARPGGPIWPSLLALEEAVDRATGQLAPGQDLRTKAIRAEH